MANLQGAWEGATDFSPLTAVMTREQLLKALVHLAPDMPNLLNHKGPFYPDDLTRDVPGAAAVLGVVLPTLAEPAVDTDPLFTGLMFFLFHIGPLEMFVALILSLWMFVRGEWLLGLSLFGFFLAHALKLALASKRHAWSRWLALLNYGMVLWYVGHRFRQHDLGVSETAAILALFQVLIWWFSLMAFLHLVCFDYAKQAREAPDEIKAG